jgi:hypothetical protein
LIEEGAIEGVFGAGEMGIARMFGRSGRMAAGNVDRLNDLLNASAKRQGITQPIKLLPGQASQLPSSQAIEAIAESSLFGANPVAKTKALIRKSAVNLVNDLPETIADGTSNLSARNVTNATKDVLLGNESFHRQVTGQLFDRLDEMSAGIPVSSDSVRNVAQSIRDEFLSIADVGFTGELKSNIEKIANLPDQITFSQAQKLRSELLGSIRDIERGSQPNSSLVRNFKKISSVVDESMDTASSELKGDANRLWRRANALHKADREVFDSKVVQSIVGAASDTNPQAVFDILNSADEQQVSTLIQGLTKRVGGKEVIDTAALDKIKGGYLAGMISKLSPEDAFRSAGKGDAVGDMLLKQFNNIPDQVKNQLFTGAEQTDIIDKFRLLSLSQKSGESGLIGLKAAQALGAVGLAAAPFSEKQRKNLGVAGGVLVLGPSVLASLMLRRPAFTRLLAEGATMSPTSREGIKVTGRLAKMVLDERKRISKQRKAVDEAIKEPSPNNKPRQDQVRAFGGTSF